MRHSHFGYNLRLLRRRARLTQTQLADRSGCANTAISLYENERQEPGVRIAHRLAVALGTSLDRLCGDRLPPV